MAHYSRRFGVLNSSGSLYEPSGAYTYGIYDVETTTSPTKVIKPNTFSGVDFQMSDVLQMWVDGVEVAPSTTYTFATTGRHVVEFDIPSMVSLAGMWWGCARLVEVCYQDSVLTPSASLTYQCHRVFEGCHLLERADFTHCDLSAMTEVSELFNGCPKFLMENLIGFGSQLGNCTIQNALISSAYQQYSSDPDKTMVLNDWVFGPGPSTYDGIGYTYGQVFAYCGLRGTLDLRGSDLSNILLLTQLFNSSSTGYSKSSSNIHTLYMGGPLNPNVVVFSDSNGTMWRNSESSSYSQWWLSSSGTFYYDSRYASDYQKLIDVMPSQWTAEPWN